MNKLTIPALLLGVVMVAGAFAFMPVEQASTVHLSSTGSNSLKFATSFSLGNDLTINVNKAFPTVDVHNQISAGYILINTSAPNVDITVSALADLKCATWDASGVIQGTPESVTLLAGEFTDTNRNTYHCHVPASASTVIVGLTADNNLVTIPAHTVITTTIDTVA